MHALPHVYQRTLGGDQRGGGGIDILRVRRGAVATRRRVVERGHRVAARDFGAPDAGHFVEHRARTTLARDAEGAAQRRDDLLGPRDDLGMLGDVLEIQRGIEGRLHIGAAATGEHHQRHAFAPALGDGAKGILDARAFLAGEHAHLVARRQAADGIGHVHADTLLAHDDRANIHFRAAFGERIQRIGKEVLDALQLQDLCRDLPDVHRIPHWFWPEITTYRRRINTPSRPDTQHRCCPQPFGQRIHAIARSRLA